MNEGHSRLTDWGLEHVRVEKNFSVLDVGCGGGRTVAKLAAMASEGAVYGVDYSDGSVAASRAQNQDLVATGRVFIEKATVSHLPFPDNKFDVVTAVETHYYWPDLAKDIREIQRVLKPGGKLVIIAEMYKGGKYDLLKWPAMWLLRSAHLTAKEHEELFSKAGYTDVEVFEERDHGWITAVGARPKASS